MKEKEIIPKPTYINQLINLNKVTDYNYNTK
jgi:hypothetical protein